MSAKCHSGNEVSPLLAPILPASALEGSVFLSVTGNALLPLKHASTVLLTFMNLGDAPDDERNLRVEVPG